MPAFTCAALVLALAASAAPPAAPARSAPAVAPAPAAGPAPAAERTIEVHVTAPTAPTAPTAAIAKSSGRAWLGCTAVALESPDDGDAGAAGVAITAVIPGGPASLAGVRQGDVVVAIDDQPVLQPVRLAEALDRRAPGSRVRLLVVRDGATRVLDATLQAAPAGVVGPVASPRILARVLQAPRPTAGGRAPQELSLRFAGDRQRPWLGVTALPLTEQLAAYFGADGGLGVLVETVVPDSPASRAGLAAGDVIVALAGRGIDSPTALEDALARLAAGETVALSLLREGRRSERPVELGERPVPVWVFQVAEPRALAPPAPSAGGPRP